MIPEETDKEGSETSQGTPSELLSPFLALIQLLRDKQCRPLPTILHALVFALWIPACPCPMACTPACVPCKVLQ